MSERKVGVESEGSLSAATSAHRAAPARARGELHRLDLTMVQTSTSDPFYFLTTPRGNLEHPDLRSLVRLLFRPMYFPRESPQLVVSANDCHGLLESVLRRPNAVQGFERQTWEDALTAAGGPVPDFAIAALFGLFTTGNHWRDRESRNALPDRVSTVRAIHKLERNGHDWTPVDRDVANEAAVAILTMPMSVSAAATVDRLLDYELPVAASPTIVGRIIRDIFSLAIAAQFLIGIGVAVDEELTHQNPVLVIETAIGDAGTTMVLAFGHRTAVRLLDLRDDQSAGT